MSLPDLVPAKVLFGLLLVLIIISVLKMFFDFMGMTARCTFKKKEEEDGKKEGPNIVLIIFILIAVFGGLAAQTTNRNYHFDRYAPS